MKGKKEGGEKMGKEGRNKGEEKKKRRERKKTRVPQQGSNL